MTIEVKKSLKPVAFQEAINVLEDRVHDVYNGKKRELLWILEHRSVYTAGTSAKKNEIIDKKINLGLPIDSKVLEEFENKTKSLNSLFSLGIDFVYEFFKFNKKFFPTKMSKKLFSFINKNEKIKNIGISIANKGLNI